jgi:hypothetical protein
MKTPRSCIALAAALPLLFAPANARAAVPTGQTVDGIKCEAMEGSVLHIHQHLAIFNHGRPVGIPDDVGRPLVGQCLYWVHTHTPDGIIHVESPTFRTYTLGNFFDIWGEPLSRSDVGGAKPKKGERIAVWVDGAPYAGDPRKIELTQHLDVTIDVGPPYKKPRPFTDWNGQ